MRIAEASVFRYSLPLTETVWLGAARMARREGYLLRLAGADGAEGWGEAAPLPGFSRETLDQTGRALAGLAADLPGREARWGRSGVEPALSARDVPASVRFAWECAVADLDAASRGVTFGAVLGGVRWTRIAVNALLPRLGPGVEEQAARLVAAGYRCLKAKVARGPVEAEAEAVRRLRDAVAGRATLRLDANRGWRREEADLFARRVGAAGIEYIEEPLPDRAASARWSTRTGLPLALDESVVEEGERVFGRGPAPRAVVLKPTLLGGLRRTMDLGAEALRRGVRPVVGAAFESGVGLRALAALAACLAPPEVASGLDTWRWLAEDVTDPPFTAEGGAVEWKRFGDVPARVRREILSEVRHG